MALKKEDYVAMGRREAECGGPGGAQMHEAHLKSSESSWQSRAWLKGYNKDKPKRDPVKGRSQFLFNNEAEESLKLWPGAAATHLRQLAKDFNVEKGSTRRARLLKALHRMQKRYGHLTA